MSNPVQTMTREMPALQMRAEFVPSSLNEEERTIDVVWTTGARVLRGWWDQYWEELSLDPKHVRMGRLTSGRAPVLMGHNSYDPDAHVGVVMTARLEKSRGIATLRYAKGDADADKAWNKVRQGILPNVSVGYRVHKLEKIEDGEGQIPVMRATDWEPYEISPVAMGADADAHARSAGPAGNPCEFVFTRGEAPQKESRTMSEQTKNPAPNEGGEGQRAATPPAPVLNEAERKAERERAAVEERSRIAGIQLAARATGFEPEKAQKMIAEGTPLDQARAVMLEAAAARSEAENIRSHSPVTGGEDQRDKFLRGAEAWLIQRAGKRELVEAAVKAGKIKAVETDPGEFRGLSLIGLAREALERSGTSTRRMSDDKIAELALARRGGGMATASDFPILLENVTYKVMLGAYETAPHEWSRFCKRGSVANFHPHNRYRPGAFGTLDAVNDHGELKQKAIPDGEKRSVTIGTYGNIIGISRKTLIQDDMGVFTDLAGAFGLSAQNTIELAVWAALKANSGLGANFDANPLFHASRANIGTGSALSVAALDADRVLMKRQPAPGGVTTLNLTPAILIVPVELEAQAKVLNNDAFDHDGATPKHQKTNAVRGIFRDIIGTAQYTGTRRYLLADPSVAPVIEVTFLQGQEAPQMESEEGFEVLGLRWRVFHDFGVNFVDYRGGLTNAGA